MEYWPQKRERNAMTRLLLLATCPDRLSSMGLELGGEEFEAANKLLEAMHKVRHFDPDVDDWSGRG
jgi:hypothetical protein